MLEEYFRVIQQQKDNNYLYIKDKCFRLLSETSSAMLKDIWAGRVQLTGRMDIAPIHIEMTHGENPKKSDPFSIDRHSRYILTTDTILVALEELGFKDFLARPLILIHAATKRTFNFWLVAFEGLSLPLHNKPPMFEDSETGRLYMHKTAKQKIEALRPHCVEFVDPTVKLPGDL